MELIIFIIFTVCSRDGAPTNSEQVTPSLQFYYSLILHSDLTLRNAKLLYNMYKTG